MAELKLGTRVSSPVDAIKIVIKQSKSQDKTLEEIRRSIQFDIPDRALQRRLGYLWKAGIVSTSGERHPTRHRFSESDAQEGKDIAAPTLPLLKESRHVRSLISRPNQKHVPVGCNQGFLEPYQSNENKYLCTEETKKLFQQEQTSEVNQIAGTYAREIPQPLLTHLPYKSSRVGGNTFPLPDTERLISSCSSANNESEKLIKTNPSSIQPKEFGRNTLMGFFLE